jgi:hypothetical protein
MWKNFDGKPYTRESLAAHIEATDFSHWKRKDGSPGRPKHIVLHNTSSPDIALWLSWSPEKRSSYINNIDDWYERKGWAAGPHFFVPPTNDPVAFGFSDLGTCGTHCSCFNSDSIGIEMVGEFNVEEFNSGRGAIVRDNAIYLMALLHRKLGISPLTLRFHVECKTDNHDCPGKHVSKAAVVEAVVAEMERQESVASVAGGAGAVAGGSADRPDNADERWVIPAADMPKDVARDPSASGAQAGRARAKPSIAKAAYKSPTTWSAFTLLAILMRWLEQVRDFVMSLFDISPAELVQQVRDVLTPAEELATWFQLNWHAIEVGLATIVIATILIRNVNNKRRLPS